MQLDRIKKNFKEIIERFKLAQEVAIYRNSIYSNVCVYYYSDFSSKGERVNCPRESKLRV